MDHLPCFRCMQPAPLVTPTRHDEKNLVAEIGYINYHCRECYLTEFDMRVRQKACYPIDRYRFWKLGVITADNAIDTGDCVCAHCHEHDHDLEVVDYVAYSHNNRIEIMHYACFVYQYILVQLE